MYHRCIVTSLLICLLICLSLLSGCTELNSKNLGDILGRDTPLDEQTVAAGLKEALRVGTERTVDNTSMLDGFLSNALIRIVMPEQFEDVASVLRDVGFGQQVTNFETAMNRAAERSAGEAKNVFWNAVTGMSVADAFGILKGHDTAATEYFRGRTETELRSRFHPIVQNKMSEVGLYQMYNELTDYYNKIPLKTAPALDLDDYITEHALNGLFTVLGQEEKKIRDDPLARTTDLLKRVFKE
ncbi:DUF4197 domain-containing protein [Candidatus Pacearchaeota archaeon]|nr:DUF4197 domain-containing protein [Candidatus Pacearchaeota archaeon]